MGKFFLLVSLVVVAVSVPSFASSDNLSPSFTFDGKVYVRCGWPICFPYVLSKHPEEFPQYAGSSALMVRYLELMNDPALVSDLAAYNAEVYALTGWKIISVENELSVALDRVLTIAIEIRSEMLNERTRVEIEIDGSMNERYNIFKTWTGDDVGRNHVVAGKVGLLDQLDRPVYMDFIRKRLEHWADRQLRNEKIKSLMQ